MVAPMGALDAYMLKEAHGPLATTTRHAELVWTRSCWSPRPAGLGKSWRRIDEKQNSRVSWKWKMQESSVIRLQKTPAPQWRASGQSPRLRVQMFVIFTLTKAVADTPMTPQGREASKPIDEIVGEFVALIDRERSPDDVR